jgi:hypothetical protein
MDEEERRLLTEWIEDVRVITKELRSLRRGCAHFLGSSEDPGDESGSALPQPVQ